MGGSRGWGVGDQEPRRMAVPSSVPRGGGNVKKKVLVVFDEFFTLFTISHTRLLHSSPSRPSWAHGDGRRGEARALLQRLTAS